MGRNGDFLRDLSTQVQNQVAVLHLERKEEKRRGGDEAICLLCIHPHY